VRLWWVYIDPSNVSDLFSEIWIIRYRKGLDHVDSKPRVCQSVPTVEGETPAAVVMVLVGWQVG